jgi:hypothetical protein
VASHPPHQLQQQQQVRRRGATAVASPFSFFLLSFFPDTRIQWDWLWQKLVFSFPSLAPHSLSLRLLFLGYCECQGLSSISSGERSSLTQVHLCLHPVSDGLITLKRIPVLLTIPGSSSSPGPRPVQGRVRRRPRRIPAATQHTGEERDRQRSKPSLEPQSQNHASKEKTCIP